MKTFEHAIDHHGRLPEVIRRITEPGELGTTEVLRDLAVLREQVEERPLLPDRLAACIVNDVVSVFAAEIRAEPHHHRFGYDEAVRDVEDLAHPLRVDLEPA